MSPKRANTPEPVWSAVVVNYNAGDHLLGCVQSLLADTSAGGPPEVVVVDNDSRDGSADRVERTHPEVVVVRAGANLGYAKAANLGIAVTRTALVAVINPDAIVESGTAGAMAARFEQDARLSALGPRVLNSDGTVYPSARTVPSPVIAAAHGVLGLAWKQNPATRRYRQLDADPDLAREADWVSGAAIWLRRSALDAVGGWDEGFFMYVEDVDLCWRLRRAGWTVGYEPGGTVTHIGGVSTAEHPYKMIIEHHRSIWHFSRKRWTGPRSVLLAPTGAYLAGRGALALGQCAGARARRVFK